MTILDETKKSVRKAKGARLSRDEALASCGKATTWTSIPHISCAARTSGPQCAFSR